MLIYWNHKCPHCGYPYTTTVYSRRLGVRLGLGYHKATDPNRPFPFSVPSWLSPEMIEEEIGSPQVTEEDTTPGEHDDY